MAKNLVYFGSPDFSAQILDSIIESKLANVVGVVTTPDKTQGRKQILTPSPVCLAAQKHNLPIYKPTKLDEDNLSHIKLLKPDIFLVVSYGKIIPITWIDTPSIGTFNIHFSLLPKYRGALCISEVIKNQDTETGVTLMELDEKMDHGPIISQSRVSVDIDDNVVTLTRRLTQAAKDILKSRLPEVFTKRYTTSPQDESLATFTPSHRNLNYQSAFVPWETIQLAQTTNNQEITSKTHALIRSLNPEPGAWTLINGQELKIIKTKIDTNRLTVESVQIPGKNPISWKQYLSGHTLPV